MPHDLAAEAAGFQPGDLLISANGQKLETFSDLSVIVRLNSGETLRFQVERAGETLEIEATPRRQVIKDAFGNDAEMGVLGVVGDEKAFHFVRYGPVDALKGALNQVWQIIHSTGKFLGRLILGKEDSRQLGGPIKIAQLSGQAATLGWLEFVYLVALISINLGFINLLPVPMLDGGHLSFYAIEAVRRRPVNPRTMELAFRSGMYVLLALMVFVTLNDLV